MGNERKPKPADLSKGASSHQLTLREERMAFYQGPIPDPGSLERYEAILPGAADRILTMAERQSEHRQTCERIDAQTQDRMANRGQIFSFVIVLFALIVVLVGMLWGRPGTSEISYAASFLVGAAALVSVFTSRARTGELPKTPSQRKSKQD